MSTPITLSVADLNLTYNTGHMGMDHGMLFQEKDRRHRRHRDIDYDEASSSRDLQQMDLCFCRNLGSMVSRLELLGYTLAAVRSEYDKQVELDREQFEELFEIEKAEGLETREPSSDRLTFDQFIAFIKTYALKDLSDEYVVHYDIEHSQGEGRFAADPTTSLLPKGDFFREIGGYSELSHFGSLIEFLSPYAILRVLAENPENLREDVVWDYGCFVNAGWAKNEDFIGNARRTQTYLIATEGTSDTHILKHGLALLRPDIEDFFRFIDIEERHPFSGTGNLSKFAEGLVKIDVHNRVIFLFDNNAEGVDTYRNLLQRFKFPVNMRAMVLPDLDELRNFPAKGPSGVENADINGCAAAIECYLDLRLNDRPPAQVTWTNYKESLNIYQGALDFKDSYAKAFYNATPDAIESGAYDASKLRSVLAALLEECNGLAAKMLESSYLQ
ncbi:HEPN/Toprim-associated domain-containing protein [Pseudomonas koreensis]|uniref:HEPN/Toprim-associated domain-containing protein n=1 Tax=Pseudomonas koreensis TaxID=198620 RepID=UPI0021C8A30C|nr:HEPN/Toprim-associated domain-containing protein [Pseudomonas koreensis]MCU0093713.1 HEPN/Toprim-associated domain-containing protein [Pseudomonas koreensis]